VELAYERDFDYIPWVFNSAFVRTTGQQFTPQISVLNRCRKPIGYIDVGALKEKWEAGQADPVRTSTLTFTARDLTDVYAEYKGIVVHDQVPTVDFNTLHRHHTSDPFGRTGSLS
jgi:hypothetical protein